MSDAVVVGAGVIGCMTACRLAELGWGVTLIDADSPPAGTTAATHSNLSIYNRSPGPELDLAIETAMYYKAMMCDGFGEVGYEELGGALLIADDDDIPAAQRRIDHQRSAGIPCELVDTATLRRSEPSIGETARAAITSAGSAVVYAPGIVHALLRRGARAGVDVRPFTTLVDASREQSHWRLRTDRGELTTEHVVIAAGARAGDIAALFGIDLTITPVRGHIVITTRQPRRGLPMLGEFVNRERHGTSHGGARLVWTHTPEGHVFIGRSSQPGVADPEVDVDVVRSVLDRARHWLPDAARMPVQRVYVGFRPQGPNGRPVVGADRASDGVWLAAGFGDIGIGLAAAGRHLADRMNGGRTPLLDPYAPLTS